MRKRILSILIAAIMVVSLLPTVALAADPVTATFDFTTNLYGHKGVSSGSGQDYVSDGDIAVGEKFNEDPTQIEFTVNGSTQTRFWDASKKHELRLYSGATFVLSITGNYKITKVEFTGSAVNLEANGVTVSDKVWEDNATKLITFVNTATGSKINSIKVTYKAVDPQAENPTITPNAVANVYWDPITVTLACETEGATIHYTLDGSDPTKESAVYSEPISISATTTVKAMAVKEGLGNSEVVSKTFTFGTVFASLEELVKNQLATNDVAYVQVTITNAVIDDFYVSSKGYTNGVFVTAADTTVEIYCNDVPETWEAGGKVSGTIKAEWLFTKGFATLQKWEGGWAAFTYSPICAITNGTTVNDKETNHGYIAIDKTTAVEGDTVTVTVTPNEGYVLKSLTADPVIPTISTIADVLATVEGFPASLDQTTPPSSAWVADVQNSRKCYAYRSVSELNTVLLLSIPTVDNTYFLTTKKVTPGENCYTASNDICTLNFNMTDGVLTGFTCTHKEGKSENYDGIYAPASTPSPRLKPITPAKQQNGTYQFTMPAANVTVTAAFEEKASDITSWSYLQNAINEATEPTTIQLTQDLTAPAEGGASITIPAGKDITLDLNGKVINANGGKFGVIEVKAGGKLTLIDSKPETEHYFTVGDDGLWTLTNTKTDKTKTVKGGVITGGNGINFGGVFVEQSDKLAGKLTMKGGNIVGNTSSNAGGGVYLQTGSTFDMEGGSIIGNITGTGKTGGGVCVSSASFTMTGGKIEYNVAASGGGVYIDKGTFTMSDGEIDNNTATGYGMGGGVCIGNGTFTMIGGKISGNNATSNGGGVYYYTGTLTLGGTAKITDNKAGSESKTANNLYLQKGKTVTLGTKTASGDGNGVAAPASGFSVGVTTQTAPVEGMPVQITTNGTEAQKACFTPDNSGYEVAFNTNHLELTKTVAPAPEYTTYQHWQIKHEGSGWEWTENLTKVEDGLFKIEINWKGSGFNIKSDENLIKKDWYATTDPDVTIGEEVIAPVTVDVYLRVIDDETLKIGVGVVPSTGETAEITTWSDLQNAINEATKPTTIQLTRDLTVPAEDGERLVIPAGKNIVLDLNGFTLDRGLKNEDTAFDKGNVFTVNGKLTIQDNSTAQTGKITGGTSAYGAAIISNGETILESGTITGCKATSTDYDATNSQLGRGGAIYVNKNGKFTMTGGEIKNCSASVAGGAIFNIGTVNIAGGKIDGCSVSGVNDGGTVKAKGGAVYNFATSHFTMTGGEISGNRLSKVADMRGAGVYAAAGANVTLGGTAKITDNTNGDNKASNLFLYDGVSFTVSTDIVPGAGMNVGVTTKTAPTSGNPVQIGTTATDYSSFFFADGSGYGVVFNDNKNVLEFAVVPVYIGNVEVKDNEIKTGDTTVTVKDANGNDIESGKLDDVAKAINEVLGNEDVKNFDETGLDTATAAKDNEIVTNLKNKTTDTTAKDKIKKEDINKYLNVKLVSATVDTNSEAVVTALVFDVTPMATITVTDSNGKSVTLTAEITNDEINGDVTFLLPVDKDNRAETAAVYHENEFLGNYSVKKDGDNKYLEVKTGAFSEFGYITLDEKTAGAKIGDTLYANLSDAVSKVANNETIKLLKNTSDTITVSRVVNFTVDSNGKTNSATIVAGSGYKISQSGNTYTVTTSGGGSTGGGTSTSNYAVELPANIKNGKIEVSPKNASAGQAVTLTVKPDAGFTLETLTVLDKNGKEIEVKNLGNNKYSFKMPNGKVTIKASFMEDNAMLNFFVDVKANDYFYDAVLWAAENKITAGTDAIHFNPNGTTTRGQMITFLWRMAGSPVFEDDDIKFVDIKKKDYFYNAVVWGWNMGIVSGKSATAFAPDDKVTRGEAVTFIYRYAKVAGGNLPNPFNDVKQGAFYYYPVLWAANNGITSGVNATTFNPGGDCTRGQIVTFLYRYNNEFGVEK